MMGHIPWSAWIAAGIALSMAGSPAHANVSPPIFSSTWRANGPRLAESAGWIYVPDGNQIIVVDARDPARPTVAARVAVAEQVDAVVMAAGYLVAVNDRRLGVFDVSDPAAPRLRGTLVPTLNNMDSTTDGIWKLIGTRGGQVWVGIQGYQLQEHDVMGIQVQVVSVDDPDRPALVDAGLNGMLGDRAGFFDVYLGDDLVFTIHSYAGIGSYVQWVETYDAADMSAKLPMAKIYAAEWYEFFGALDQIGRYLYATIISSPVDTPVSHLNIYDLSDPAKPRLVATYPTLIAPQAVSGRRGYMLRGTDVQVLDVKSPARPVAKGTVASSRAIDGITASGNFAYVLRRTTTLLRLDVLDATDVDHPVSAARLDLGLPSYTDNPRLRVYLPSAVRD
jgi:hypothetical protein